MRSYQVIFGEDQSPELTYSPCDSDVRCRQSGCYGTAFLRLGYDNWGICSRLNLNQCRPRQRDGFGGLRDLESAWLAGASFARDVMKFGKDSLREEQTDPILQGRLR